MQIHPVMETHQRCFRRRELTFGQQPALIAERQARHLIREFQLQLLASLGQRGAELKQMPLDQTGRGGDGHNGPGRGRMEVWHRASGF